MDKIEQFYFEGLEWNGKVVCNETFCKRTLFCRVGTVIVIFKSLWSIKLEVKEGTLFDLMYGAQFKRRSKKSSRYLLDRFGNGNLYFIKSNVGTRKRF